MREISIDAFETDAFLFGEQAIVGHLASAAGRAGLIALPEYAESRTNFKKDERRGRCDLWIGDPQSKVNWAFEFKVCWLKPGTNTRIKSTIKSASDAARIRKDEADKHFSCTAFVPWRKNEEDAKEDFDVELFSGVLKRLHAYKTRVDLAYKIYGDGRPVFLLFERV